MFYSQFKQDSYIENNIFKGHEDGIFVDVGAHDGITFNNTLYFERENNWTGINIEPIKLIYDKLCNNRPKCININCAVSDKDGVADFICNSGYTEMLSGLVNDYDERHFNRLENELKIYGGKTNVISVETKRLETIFDMYNIKTVNYLSIDVEGAEYSVIKSINFDKVFIDLIGFENNYEDVSIDIISYLKSHNYILLNKGSDIFMIHKDSRFYKP